MSIIEYISGKPAKWFVSLGFYNKTVGNMCLQNEDIYESITDNHIIDYIKFDRKIKKEILQINQNNLDLLKRYEKEYETKKSIQKEEKEEKSATIEQHQYEILKTEKKTEKQKDYDKLKKMDKKELIKLINENIEKAELGYLADIAFELKYY